MRMGANVDVVLHILTTWRFHPANLMLLGYEKAGILVAPRPSEARKSGGFTAQRSALSPALGIAASRAFEILTAAAAAATKYCKSLIILECAQLAHVGQSFVQRVPLAFDFAKGITRVLDYLGRYTR